mmetsp:Transcript_21259/g.58114  ORF Transcript_21259/g.58114 Transcript_21259/m.58114 type:complete len:200 (+) Transcript_21259:112-711(+)
MTSPSKVASARTLASATSSRPWAAGRQRHCLAGWHLRLPPTPRCPRQSYAQPRVASKPRRGHPPDLRSRPRLPCRLPRMLSSRLPSGLPLQLDRGPPPRGGRLHDREDLRRGRPGSLPWRRPHARRQVKRPKRAVPPMLSPRPSRQGPQARGPVERPGRAAPPMQPPRPSHRGGLLKGLALPRSLWRKQNRPQLRTFAS